MCFRRSQVQFSKRYEEGGAAQDNLLPPTLPSRGLHGFAKGETSVQLSGRNAGYDARLLPDRVFQDGLRNLETRTSLEPRCMGTDRSQFEQKSSKSYLNSPILQKHMRDRI